MRRRGLAFFIYGQLESEVNKRQGKVKLHTEEGTVGRITSLYPENDCGWIKSSDGREVYFHRNSLLNGNFDSLTVGTSVQFIEHEDSEVLHP